MMCGLHHCPAPERHHNFRNLYSHPGRLVHRPFQFSGYIFQQLADGQVLGAMLFTFPACHALAGSGTFAPQSCCEQILDFRMASLGGSAVIAGKHAGDIHPRRARLTVPTAGASHPHRTLQVIPQCFHKSVLFRRHTAGMCFLCLGSIVPDHFQAVHTGQHHRNPRLIPQPA